MSIWISLQQKIALNSGPFSSPCFLHACIHSALSLTPATLECHQLHTWLAQCLFKLIALYDIMCCKWNRKMCYGSWNYGTFQFSFFLFASSSSPVFFYFPCQRTFFCCRNLISSLIRNRDTYYIFYFTIHA